MPANVMLDRSSWGSRRVVVVVAHPDDETIGMGGRLESIPDVTLIHVTDGAPRTRSDWRSYAHTRRSELLAAARIAGIAKERCLELCLPDQEASMHLVELTCHLSRLFAQLEPDLIFTHPYEGGHPDHDATAFAVHHAVQLGPERAPHLIEFASYHRSPSSESIEVGCFLPGRSVQPLRVFLNEHEIEVKRRMMSCFATQSEALAPFRDDLECFRPAPRYDFTHPAHRGALYYDSFKWGATGAEWRRLARHAEKCLGPVGVL